MYIITCVKQRDAKLVYQTGNNTQKIAIKNTLPHECYVTFEEVLPLEVNDITLKTKKKTKERNFMGSLKCAAFVPMAVTVLGSRMCLNGRMTEIRHAAS